MESNIEFLFFLCNSHYFHFSGIGSTVPNSGFGSSCIYGLEGFTETEMGAESGSCCCCYYFYYYVSIIIIIIMIILVY